MGDLSTEDLKSATDEVLAVLKSENYNDSQRKQDIEGIIDRLTDENFNTLVVLGQQLIDYDPMEGEFRGNREEIIDVNVELDESEESDSQPEGGSDNEGADKEDAPVQENDDDEESKEVEAEKPTSKDHIELGQIDAQWLNRTLSESFPDKMAEEVQELEQKVMQVLSFDNARECEKKLFGLLSVEHFEVIRLLVKNKSAIFFGSLLQQAQTQKDKDAIVREMELSKEGRDLLDQLSGRRNILDRADDITKKYKQPTVQDVTDMLDKRVTDEILLGSSKSQKLLDFDHLQFQQSARLLAN